MSNENSQVQPPVSNVPVQDGVVKSTKQLVEFASDLQDTEATTVARIMYLISGKWSRRANTADNLEMMRDEILTRLMEIGIVATVDPTPCFYNEPPIVEIIGHIPGHDKNKYGMDHEQKKFEVLRSKERGEEYYGQKEKAK